MYIEDSDRIPATGIPGNPEIFFCNLQRCGVVFMYRTDNEFVACPYWLRRLIDRSMLKKARRIAVFIVGSTVVLFGIALLVLPGPAVVVIPIGLAILATEYAWARRWLRIIRESAEKGADKLNLRSFFSRNPFKNNKSDDSSR